MGSLYGFINQHYRIWDPFEVIENNEIHVSEIWMQSESQNRLVRHRKIPNSDVRAWLANTVETIQGLQYSIILRLVWVEFQHKEKRQHFSPPILDMILEIFHLRSAYQWNWTCSAGSTRFPAPQTPEGSVLSFSMCNHPKVALTWSYTPSNGLTQGIYLAGPDQIPDLQNLLESLAGAAGHAMLPALAFAINLSGTIERGHRDIKERVRSVEVRTRFHNWASRTEAPAEGSFVSLSASVAGAKTRLASLSRQTKIIHELCRFIRENMFPEISEKGQAAMPSRVIDCVKTYTHILERRTVFQEADIPFFQERAKAQSTALSMMIAREQAAINTNIASSALQDSPSLKTLALVTMFFLPGTFVATLFSVPLLKWDDAQVKGSGEALKGKFWVYWAFAIPLTLLTFGAWVMWTRVLKRRAERLMQWKTVDVEFN